jgi:chemotaxis protein histidine kinase CheA/CheY-like chemotaxis protein
VEQEVLGEALGAIEAALDRLMARPALEPGTVLPALELLGRAVGAVAALQSGVVPRDPESMRAAARALAGPTPARTGAGAGTGAAAEAGSAAGAGAGPGTSVAGTGTGAGSGAVARAHPGPPPREAPPTPVPASIEWIPTVPPDMLDPFFEEAGDRLDALGEKLLKLEHDPTDRELLNEIFRDIHTVKGGSGIVGLGPMNALAHRMEDFFGEIRDGRRSVMQPDVDLLLGGIDRLKGILEKARARAPIDVAYEDLVAALTGAPGLRRAPAPTVPVPPPAAAAAVPAPAAAPVSAPAATFRPAPPPAPAPEPASGSATAAAPAPAPAAAASPSRGTLRVDFEKLDSLMNLVGELVIGRARVHDDLGNLTELDGELAAVRRDTAKLLVGAGARDLAAIAADTDRVVREAAVAANGAGSVLTALRSDLGRVFARAAVADAGAARALEQRVDEEIARVQKLFETVAQGLTASATGLDFALSQLQHQVMKLRMVPVGNVFTKYRRTVRDLARELGKEVNVEIEGADTELDKILVERLDDPLMHLVRNSCDHGIEPPEERERKGKPRAGTVFLRAEHRGNQIVIEVGDDGAGIPVDRVRQKAREQGVVASERLDAMEDRELLNLIFLPGFSTAKKVSAVSGRGVGMDVVRDAIVRLRGSIDVESTLGAGSRFRLKLPLTLAIIQVLVVRVSGETFAVPLSSVERTIRVPPEAISELLGEEVVELGGDQVTLVRLHDLLGIEGEAWRGEEVLEVPIVIVHMFGRPFGLVVDQLVATQDIVIKSMGDLLEEVPLVAGATLHGDGCMLILDTTAIVQRALAGAGGGARRGAAQGELVGVEAGPADPAATPAAPRRVLLVEDSDMTRRTMRKVLESAGLHVTEARDGEEALALAVREHFDLVSTDVIMPRKDGYELTRALRALEAYRRTPIVMVTAKSDKIDRVRGFDAGVDDYLVKPFGKAELLKVLGKHL